MALTKSLRRRRPAHAADTRLRVELLEQRNLLDGGLANVLVNDPNLDFPFDYTLPDGSTITLPADTQSETSLVLGGPGRVIVAYNDQGTIRLPNAIAEQTGYSLTRNGGRSFDDEGGPPEGPNHQSVSDPVLARSNRTGTIFFAAISSLPSFVYDRVNVFRSLDNGSTFEPSVDGTPGFVVGIDSPDKPWLTVDNFPGPDGSGYGNVYLAWRDFSTNKVNDGILLTRSTDDGISWGPDGGIRVASPGSETQPGPPSANGAFVTVGPDHAVYVFWWDKRFLMRKSTDHGNTFGPTVTVADLRRQTWDLGLGGFRVLPFFQAAVNPVNGHLYVVYHDNVPSGDRADVFFRQSTDGGATWGPEVRVNDDATKNDQWSPALAVTSDGQHVGVFWYDRRLDPANNLIDRYGVIGTVTGSMVPFGPNFRVTNASFPPVYGQDLTVGPTYMGDYDQAVADNNYFYTTWGDNRLANPNYPAHTHQPDVRFAKIPAGWTDAGSSFVAVPAPASMPATRTVNPRGTGAAASPTVRGTDTHSLGLNAALLDRRLAATDVLVDSFLAGSDSARAATSDTTDTTASTPCSNRVDRLDLPWTDRPAPEFLDALSRAGKQLFATSLHARLAPGRSLAGEQLLGADLIQVLASFGSRL